MDLSVIGYFSKTHGVKGQLIIKADKEFFSEDVKAIFIETSTGLAPYFVKELSPNNSGYIIELEDVDAIEKAKLLIGKKVHVNTDLLDEQEEGLLQDPECRQVCIRAADQESVPQAGAGAPPRQAAGPREEVVC